MGIKRKYNAMLTLFEHLDEAIIERAKAIRFLVLDVDGVLSDGRLYFTADGDAMKAFHTQDGQGIRFLQQQGIEVGIITGRKSIIVERRLVELGIRYVSQGRDDKMTALQEFRERNPVTLEQIAYMGDDFPDLPVIQQVGLGISPGNGHRLVQSQAHWVTQAAGGQGAVREVCDLILFAQGHMASLYQQYCLLE